MGICYSRSERQGAVVRSKARRRYMKQLVKARHALLEAQTSYLRALSGTGAALLYFTNSQSHLCNKYHNPPIPPPQLPPLLLHINSSSENRSSSSFRVTPLPSSSPPGSNVAPASATADGEEAKEAPSAVDESLKDSNTKPETDDPVITKDLVEIIKEVNEHFFRARDGGTHVSFILGAPISVLHNQGAANRVHNCSKGWNPFLDQCGTNSSPINFSGVGKVDERMKEGNACGFLNSSHRSTIECLYALEKKLLKEVKDAEILKIDHEKMVGQLKKQEAKGAEHAKTEKGKKEIEKLKLENKMMVSSQSIETISEEISRLREEELFPQLLELFKGYINMWKSMYECHQAQYNELQQLKYLHDCASAPEPVSKSHRQYTVQLEREVQQWHSAFCNLIKSQKDYVLSLTGWLRLSLFQSNHHSSKKTQQSSSSIYSLFEEWQLALDRIDGKGSAEDIKRFTSIINSIILQQVEEKKQKKRMEVSLKELEEKVAALQSLEKFDPDSVLNEDRLPSSSPSKLQNIDEKRAEVYHLSAKAKGESEKHERCVRILRGMTLNSLQTELPVMLKAVTSFSRTFAEALESIDNKLKSADQRSV